MRCEAQNESCFGKSGRLSCAMLVSTTAESPEFFIHPSMAELFR
jgi:hypothetical protein